MKNILKQKQELTRLLLFIVFHFMRDSLLGECPQRGSQLVEDGLL